MATIDIEAASLAAIGQALRDGSLGAAALADLAIVNHEKRGDGLMAYKSWDPPRFRREAAVADAAFAAGIDLGPLQGIPVSVKDLFGVHGYPTFAGSSRALPELWEREGPVVRALRRQLAPVSGKTHTVQFAYGALGTNAHWGTPRNPWDAQDHRVPGGSSAGAGVSLWEGSALLALGTDSAGSVRMPASFTGTVGIKTTYGRWPVEGIVPLSSSLDTAGVLARSVADAALAFAALDPLESHDPDRFLARVERAEIGDFRLGICDWYFEDCDPGIAEGAKAAIDALARAGARLVPLPVPAFAEAYEIFRDGGLAAYELPGFLDDALPDFRADLDPRVAVRFAELEATPVGKYVRRRRRLEAAVAEVHAAIAGVDAVVGPTMPLTPPRLADVETPEAHLKESVRAPRNTVSANMLRMSAVTMPVALDAVGMPVGLQLVCAGGEDARALAIARACEKVLGTARQRLGVPPLCAD